MRLSSPEPGVGALDGNRRGGGRLPHPALAAEEDETLGHAVPRMQQLLQPAGDSLLQPRRCGHARQRANAPSPSASPPATAADAMGRRRSSRCCRQARTRGPGREVLLLGRARRSAEGRRRERGSTAGGGSDERRARG